MISLSPNDGGPMEFCLCPACEAADAQGAGVPRVQVPISAPSAGEAPFALPATYREISPGIYEHVSFSDRVMKFYAAIAAQAKVSAPGILFGGIAYSLYRSPPVATPVPENLLVGYVGFNYLDAGYLETSRREWQEWQALVSPIELDPGIVTRKLCIRSNLLSGGWGMPVAYTRQLGEDIARWRQNRLGFFDCCYQNWATDGLNYYVLARLLWNPDLSVEEIVAQYCSRGFGPAAREIRAYFDLVESVTDRVSGLARDRGLDPYRVLSSRLLELEGYSPEILSRMHRHLVAARRLAAADRRLLARINFLAVGWQYARRRCLALAAEKAYFDHPHPETLAAFSAEIEAVRRFHQAVGVRSWAINVPYQVVKLFTRRGPTYPARYAWGDAGEE